MGYPQKLLNPNEEKFVDIHPHWMLFIKPALVFLSSLIPLTLWVLADPDAGHRQYLAWGALAIIVVSFFFFVPAFFRWKFTHFVVTNSRIIYRTGWLNKKGIDIPLDRVNNVIIDHNFFERLVKAGDIFIESAGESGRQEFHDIGRPDWVQNQIHEQITLSKNPFLHGGQHVQFAQTSQQAATPQPPTPHHHQQQRPPSGVMIDGQQIQPISNSNGDTVFGQPPSAQTQTTGAPTPPDITLKLERLEGLRERGVLSEEEFERQKQRILQMFSE